MGRHESETLHVQPLPSPLRGHSRRSRRHDRGGRVRSPIAAIGYGLTLAKAANAHLTVQSASWRLTGDDAWLGEFDYVGEALVDRRLDALARSIAERAAGDAAQVGVVCTTEAPGLTYPTS